MRTPNWALVAIACLSGGCAVTTAGLYGTDNRAFTSGIERVEPLGTVERRVSLSTVDFDRVQSRGWSRARRAREEGVRLDALDAEELDRRWRAAKAELAQRR